MLREPDTTQTTLRSARLDDAAAIWRIVRDSQVLDLNSPYAYLLLCRHHHRTCVVAEEAGEVVGFVAAYVPPGQPDTVFVWQVGVAASHRRRGLGGRLIDGLLRQCPEARFLECTVSPSNGASLALFGAVAAGRGAALVITPAFSVDDFPDEAPAHEREDLIRIGPFAARPSDPSRPGRSELQ